MDKAVSDLWWKNAVVYCLDVGTYVDASGEGVGDFRGLRYEIHRIIGSWMQMSVSGLRVDAVPYLIGEAGIWDEMPNQPHSVLRDMRKFMGRRRGDAVMVGEVNLDYGESTKFFGHYGEEMTGPFNFILTGAVFNALATEDARSLVGHLSYASHARRVPVDELLRNHDELNLGRLPHDERETVHNSSGQPANVRLDIGEREKGDELMEVFGDREYDPLDPGDPTLHIAGYGYRWMRAQGPGGSALAS